jgi:hypothetical protein
MPWVVKKQMRTAAKQKMSYAQKKAMVSALAERDLLMRLWQKWRESVLDTALEGPYRVAIQNLITFLDKMTLKDERQLVKVVKTGPWQTAHKDIKFLVKRLVDARLIVLREKQDLPPFDDALPGEPLTVYQILYRHIG